MTYYAIIDRAADGSYGATFPDLPGCAAAGNTLPEAQANAAIAAHDWLRAADSAPEPRDRDALLKDSEVSSALATGSLLAAVDPVAPAAPEPAGLL